MKFIMDMFNSPDFWDGYVEGAIIGLIIAGVFVTFWSIMC